MIRYSNSNHEISTANTNGDQARMMTALRYIAEAYSGEPLFVVRGRDMLAVPTATAYAGFASVVELQGPVLDAVFSDIQAIQLWQTANPTLLKYPDRKKSGKIHPA